LTELYSDRELYHKGPISGRMEAEGREVAYPDRTTSLTDNMQAKTADNNMLAP
jgi:hypothetical protein